MKLLLLFPVMLSFFSCSSQERWDTAQRQESIEDERRFDLDNRMGNQFPGGRGF